MVAHFWKLKRRCQKIGAFKNINDFFRYDSERANLTSICCRRLRSGKLDVLSTYVERRVRFASRRARKSAVYSLQTTHTAASVRGSQLQPCLLFQMTSLNTVQRSNEPGSSAKATFRSSKLQLFSVLWLVFTKLFCFVIGGPTDELRPFTKSNETGLS